MLSNKKVKKDNTEEEKKIAEKLKEAISQAEETAIALDEEAMKEMDYFQHSPEEQLSMDIASHIADNAARRVGEILGDVDYDIARQLVIRFDTSDSKTAVSMIQAVLVGACHAYAAGDPISTVNKLSEFIFSLIRAIGLILLGLGIMQVGLSLKSHDPSQRANGFLTVAGGIIITFTKEILTMITG